MRILITGGTGLIGTALATELVRHGHEVIALSRNPERHRRDEVPGADLVAYDGKTAEGWGHLVNADTAIVNLAGESIAGEGFPPKRWTEEKKQRILQSRVDVGRAMVEAVESAAEKPRVLIQASGTDYYGWPGDQVVTEDSPPGDTFLARVTHAWEQSTEPVEHMGVRRCVIRSGMVLSDRGGSFPVLLIPFRFFFGGPLGRGEQYYAWIHIDDAVRAIRFLIENEEASGPYNLVAPTPVKQKVLARIVGQAMRRPWFIPAPAPAVRLMIGEQAELVLRGQRAIPRRLTEAGFEFRYPDPEQAVRDLLGR